MKGLASSVFRVPGGPTSNTPFGILAPTAVNFSGEKAQLSLGHPALLHELQRHCRMSLQCWVPSETLHCSCCNFDEAFLNFPRNNTCNRKRI